MIASRVDHLLKEQVEMKITVENIVHIISQLTMEREALALMDRRLRDPDHPFWRDTKAIVMFYARSLLTTSQILEKHHPTEKKELKAISKNVQFYLELVGRQAYLTNPIDIVAYLVRNNDKLMAIVKKHGDRIPN